MPLPNDLKNRDLISKYLDEAVGYRDDIDCANHKLNEVFDAVKESEETTNYSLKEFKALLKAEIKGNKLKQFVEEHQQAFDDLSVLKG